MAFNTSISGLQAAQKDMGVIGNNIATVSYTHLTLPTTLVV